VEDSDHRLSRCMMFRRFLITKSLQLVGRTSYVAKAGSPFSPLQENAVIASSLSLGPLVFAEFCSHCYHLERTSISPDLSAQELSLTQLSLRAFTLCVSGMVSDAGHSLSKAERVNAILSCATGLVSNIAPASKESWAYYKALEMDESTHTTAPKKELMLKKSLLAFVSDSNPTDHRVCLFKELLLQSMNGEAMECANLVLVAASALTEPNLRENLGAMMLKCYESFDGEHVGVLGIDYGEDDGHDTTCVSHVVDVVFQLSGQLGGETNVPLRGLIEADSRHVGEEHLRSTRSIVGLPTTKIENWPAKHHERLKELLSNSCSIGIVQQIAWAMTGTLDIGNRFNDTFREAPIRKELRLPCIKLIFKTPQSNMNREISSISQCISACIEESLDTADFVVRLIPNMCEKSMGLGQRFLSCFLHSISQVICASAPSAEFVDINGSFASALLKSSKHLYTSLVRFISSYTANPQSMASEETKTLFDFMTFTLKPRIAALLLTLQEKHETTGGKYLAESKIESYGRTASQLVFEKEKLDNTLLKMGATLKQSGLEDDSKWLGTHVVNSLDSDFVIKNVEQAKEREAPKAKKPKSAGSKRKVKKEHTEKKKKVKKENGDASDAEEHNDDESEAVSCEVVDMDEGMDEDDDSEEESENDVDEEECSHNQSEDDESEEEAEFD
jgi:hypothetical protein